MREVDLFSLINQMADHDAVLPSCSHIVDLVQCLYLTSFYHIGAHSNLHHGRRTGSTAYRVPDAQKFICVTLQIYPTHASPPNAYGR